MLQLIRQGVGSPDEYAIIAPMRVLVVATPAAPAITRLAPTLATLLAHGAEIHAHEPLGTELTREGIPHTPLNAAALDATIRSLTAADLLIAPLGPGDVREPLAAVARALSLGVNTPLILVDPADAGDLIGALSLARGGSEAGGEVGGAARERLTQHAAFAVAAALAPTARGGNQLPEREIILLERVRNFAHGENPHQHAAAYRRSDQPTAGPLSAQLVQGAEPTLNDLLDLDAGARLVADLPIPSAALIRHTDPIGVATAETPLGALRRALETDSVATSGAIIALNTPIDQAAAAEIANGSYEAVIAPGVADATAASTLATRKDLRVLIYSAANPTTLDIIGLSSAVLLQTPDHGAIERAELRVVTERRPTLEELTDLLFAWRTVRHVRSNAIVVARGAATLGIGAAQVNRRVAVEIALQRAGDRARGAVLASDAYFPFAEGISAAAAAGITAVVQPGGSRRDAAAIEIANRNGMAMVFTGRRHYRR
ncbi:MAG: bifunctional phosphoribosylaminoimidazolecarboxamide formyltransferase/IMP cyclohydrolase PurH [Chloroflexi bacterium]|nr:MAG: bifunctional phosphoribosylaminoimidazolecarboxamide formyltransferase/IMP cyclohydrolase PurH [Chloroflexota bacterium]